MANSSHEPTEASLSNPETCSVTSGKLDALVDASISATACQAMFVW